MTTEYIPLKRCSNCGERSTQSLCRNCKTKVIARQKEKLSRPTVQTDYRSDRDFYNSTFWKNLSAWKRKTTPYCQAILHTGKVCYSTKHLTADHIIPRSQGGTDTPDNLQTLCLDCHTAKTNRENGLFGQRGEVIVVTGAPGSGKSHYIRSQWQRGDLIIDLDRLVPAITLDTYTNEPKHVLKLAWALRDAAIKHAQRSASYARLWITETAPTRQRRDYLRTTLSAKVIVMRAPQDTCIKRAHSQQDRKHGNWSAVIADWFAKYQHSPDDVLIDSSEI